MVDLARAGLTPDGMPGTVAGCMPTIVIQNQPATHAGAIVAGTERIGVRVTSAHAKLKTIDILACPVTISPHPHQIEAARFGDDARFQALGWVREGLIESGILREVVLTAAMPRLRPWLRSQLIVSAFRRLA